VSGFIPAGALLPNNFVIPYHNPNTGKGYQRPAQPARINELVSDLRKERTDLPTAILLNLRNRDAKYVLQENSLDLSRLDDHVSGTAAITREALAKFYIVDGQHRILALEKLMEDDPDGKWENFLIPFVCMLGASEDEEMHQFYTVNSKAKSVRTDLALEMLRKLSEKDAGIMEALTEKGKDWQVHATELVHNLAETSPIWRQRIRFAAMEKGETTMPLASIVASLKPVLSSPYFKALDMKDQVKIVDAFWRGLRNLMQDAFDTPEEFVFQKGVGVIVLHTMMVQVIELVRARGNSVTDPEAYEDVLREPLERLQGENSHAATVSGLDFWRAGPEGAAGSYSSSAGRRVLIAKIQALLPRIALA